MKTYSVTHNPSNKEKSKHNLPDEMIIKLKEGICLSSIESSYRWGDSKYGFFISDEELAKYTPLYLSKGGNTYDEVYVVDISTRYHDHTWYNPWCFSTDNNWTFVYRTKETIPHSSEKKTFLRLYGRELTKSPQKLFLNVDEMFAYYKKENEKRLAKHAANREKWESTNNGPLNLSTPKLKIMSINQSTQSIPDAKEGDVIYGVINVLNNDGKNVLHAQSSYVNYVDVYLNDKKINSLPMSTFGTIMSINFKLKQI